LEGLDSLDETIKIAVSLSGMPRNFEQCYENTLEFFNVDNTQVDFFIHAWSNEWYPSRVKSKSKNSRTGKKLELDKLANSLHEVYKPKKICVEDQLSCKDLAKTIKYIKRHLLSEKHKSKLPEWMITALDQNKIDTFLSSPFHLAQTYSISRTAKMIDEDTEDYDLVVRYRFDNYIELRDRVWRTKMFHDMVGLIKHAEERSAKASKFHRDYLFVAWITVMGENGFARNATWIGDKVFACAKHKFSNFIDYFKLQIDRILSYDLTDIYTNHEAPFFMPEHTLHKMCIDNSFFAHSKGYLNKLSLVSYRDYHINLEQTFENLKREYIIREKMNHDSADGIVLGL